MGCLYLVATPIGNLEDITLRALRILKEVDLVAAEDTRRTRVLLDHYGIKVPMESYHIHNEHRKTGELLRRVRGGLKLALVSDAGMPCVADPGFLMVREALALGIEPEIVPGVSSLTFAVAASGLPSDCFSFFGFLPVKQGRRRALLERIREEGRTAVLFESPFRIGRTLEEVAEVTGAETRVALLREATKMHEEVLRGSAAELCAAQAGRSWKGEFVLVLSPSEESDAKDREEFVRE